MASNANRERKGIEFQLFIGCVVQLKDPWTKLCIKKRTGRSFKKSFLRERRRWNSSNWIWKKPNFPAFGFIDEREISPTRPTKPQCDDVGNTSASQSYRRSAN